ncbi:MAG: twin-arginine translocation signal domain-containing protein, partial [Planctomycetota bacterium]
MAAADTGITRRGFLQRASVLAALTAPTVVPSTVFGSGAPSNRI